MTEKAQIKAKELVDFFIPFIEMDATWAVTNNAKLCAFKVCEEILNSIEVPSEGYKFWTEVKEEIEKL
jgi:hypothetical protein